MNLEALNVCPDCKRRFTSKEVRSMNGRVSNAMRKRLGGGQKGRSGPRKKCLNFDADREAERLLKGAQLTEPSLVALVEKWPGR